MALTPNPGRRSWVGPSSSPFLTPRPERRRLDLRWADGSSQGLSRGDRDREVNVQVVLRCRPLSDEEQKLNVQKAICCNDLKKEVIVLHSLLKQPDKTFTFDKVFGPKAQQRSIYDHAIAPIVHDVLEGHNCTVFAFGPTGTGKTYTMEGEMSQKAGDIPANAGVIPRAVRHIFDTLEAHKADYSMKVTFLELYNEEITDLLALEDQARFPEDRQRRPISLMEDGKGGAIIRGLEEVVVYSPNEIYGLLERGSARRRTADTMLNKQSSRSHSVFSINIHVKETTMGNEELLKCGRLNLVDLAGSENIARSGAREGRAREAGEMNKSLLTLGRVITALVEHSVHVPYRDSKLTRLLRESLGGKAKTCIIATISPSIHCLEETLVTIDYAYRAKHIKNKPEANQKMSKSVLLKDIYQEIERMKQDVKAAREKNGIYIPHERFVLDEAEKKAVREKIEHLELTLENQSKEAEIFKGLYMAEQERSLDLESQNKELKINLESCMGAYLDLQEALSRTNISLKEKDFIISNLLCAEHALLERAKNMHINLENASGDVSVLLKKLERQSKTEGENKGLLLDFQSQLDQSLGVLHNTVIGSVCEQHRVLRSTDEQIKSYFSAKSEAAKCLEIRIAKTKDLYASGVHCMKELGNTLQQKSTSDLEQMKLNIYSQAMAVENFLTVATSEAEQVANGVQTSINEQKELLAFFARQQEAALQRSLNLAQLISRTEIGFFNSISAHASRLIKLIEEKQMQNSSQLLEFEKAFKELSAREEQAALNKIAGILKGLSAAKNATVSKAVAQLNENCSEELKNLQSEMSDLQQVSDKGEKEAIAYAGMVESHFREDRSSHSKINDQTENVLQQCLRRMDHSVSYWSNAQLSLNSLNMHSIAQAEDFIQGRTNENESILQEMLLVSSQTDAKFHAVTSDILTASESSLLLDHETRQKMESVSASSSDNLESLKEKHNQRTESIRRLASDYLEKEYIANSPLRHPPQELPTSAFGMESIEELRASLTDLVAKFRSENELGAQDEGNKQLDQKKRTPRSPLMPINHYDQ